MKRELVLSVLTNPAVNMLASFVMGYVLGKYGHGRRR